MIKGEDPTMGSGRVWIVTEDYPPKLGGLSRWSFIFAWALRELGASVSVLAKSTGGGRVDPGSCIFPVTGRSYHALRHLYFMNAARRLARLEKRWPDLILCSTWRPAEGMLLARPACPVITAVQGLELFTRYNPLLRLRRRMVLEGVAVAAAGSGFTARRLAAVAPRARMITGINGVDTTRFTPDGPSIGKDFPVQLISVGRLVRRKGFELAIDALGAAVASGVDAGLWVVGRGPLEIMLREHAASLGERVRFLGEVDDGTLASLYRSTDLFVSPCMSDEASGDVEGFGLTFIEASACGTAVAGLAEGGVIDAVEHGVSGILTDRAGFRDSVAALCRNQALMASLGSQGRERAVRLFDIRKVVRNLVDSVPGLYPGR